MARHTKANHKKRSISHTRKTVRKAKIGLFKKLNNATKKTCIAFKKVIALSMKRIGEALFALAIIFIAIFAIHYTYLSNDTLTPASKYVDFTIIAFDTVEHGDIDFTVYYKNGKNFVTTGDLQIWLVNAGGTESQVWTKPYAHKITSDAIMLRIKANQLSNGGFDNTVGTYQIRACYSFTIDYGIKKYGCVSSNDYDVSTVPDGKVSDRVLIMPRSSYEQS